MQNVTKFPKKYRSMTGGMLLRNKMHFNRNYVSKIPFSSYSELSKVADFNLSTPFEFRRNLWRQKTRFPELSCGVACVISR